MAERFGVEDRGRFYDAVGALRDVVVNHLLQLTAAATMDAPRKSETLDDARHRLLSSDRRRRSRPLRSRPVHRLPGNPGVASRSTTETYAALELRIDNERWRGVPVLHPHREAPSDHPDRGPPDLPRRLPAHLPRQAQAAERERARGQDRPRNRHPHDPRSASRRRVRPRADHARHGVRRAGRRGPDPVRGSSSKPRSGATARSSPARRRSRSLAHRPAAPRRQPADPQLPERELGPAASRRAPRTWKELAPALDGIGRGSHPTNQGQPADLCHSDFRQPRRSDLVGISVVVPFEPNPSRGGHGRLLVRRRQHACSLEYARSRTPRPARVRDRPRDC